MLSVKWQPFCFILSVFTMRDLLINSLRLSEAFIYIYIANLTIIGSDNGMSSGQHQAIIWTNAGILLIEPLGTNFSEILVKNSYIFIQENAFEKVLCIMAAILSWPLYLQWELLINC